MGPVNGGAAAFVSPQWQVVRALAHRTVARIGMQRGGSGVTVWFSRPGQVCRAGTKPVQAAPDLYHYRIIGVRRLEGVCNFMQPRCGAGWGPRHQSRSGSVLSGVSFGSSSSFAL
ncbi:hypothetical protein GCM10007387_31970 [Pseudoduganella albidiflava]|uniref:Uncharacterized protein n=1 Tax=Pseudoduganella albidiflava TaxID=321983 RepID=A0AA87XXI3_9BURK|nr:hypothetical protein GCM10007387_31970 [Pseudoduganella albidiflava]